MYRVFPEETRLLLRMLNLKEGTELPKKVEQQLQLFKHCQHMTAGTGALSRETLWSVAVSSGCVSIPAPHVSKFEKTKPGTAMFWTRGSGDEIEVAFVRLATVPGIARIKVYGNERELSESVLSLESAAAKTPVKLEVPAKVEPKSLLSASS